MANTTFVNQATPIVAEWLNDVNDEVYQKAYNVKVSGGAVGDGVTNDSAAFALAATALASGQDVYIPPGQYMLSAQVTFDVTNALRRLHIYGYGAELFTTNAISAIKVTGKSTPHGLTISGVKVNHRGNSTAIAGFEIVGTDHCVLRDCVVEAHGVSGTYAAYWLRNTTAASSDTGAFWTILDNCTCRKRSGADSGDITYGVKLQGAANATYIVGGSIKTATTGVYFVPESGQTYIANGVVIDGVPFEGGTTAIHASQNTTVPVSGLRITNCRIETYTTFLSLTGATTQPAVPVYLAGNYLLPDVTTYINNPNNLYIYKLDSSQNPPISPVLDTYAGLTINNRGATGNALTLKAGVVDTGFILQDTAGATSIAMRDRGGGFSEILGGASDSLRLSGIQGLSGTSTSARNLRGTATFAAATTVAVTFAFTETNTSYFVYLTPQADPVGRLWVSGKTTGGFTINNSSSTSIAVDWLIVR